MNAANLPPVLYKFMPASFDNGKTVLPLLKSGHIRFSQPKAMNDPYEIVGGFRDETDYDVCFQKHREDALKAVRMARVRGKKVRVPLHKLVPALNTIRDSGYLVSGEMAQQAMQEFQQRLLNYGILSLSTNWSSSAMWSHYACTHTGVCMGFDSTMPLFHRRKHEGIFALRPVNYSDERVPLAVNDKEIGVPKDIFFRKSSDWSYEAEWRVVSRFSDLPPGTSRKNGTHNGIDVVTLPIDLERVTEILIGSRAAPEVETAALDFARRSPRKVDVYRMQLSSTSFRMERGGPL